MSPLNHDITPDGSRFVTIVGADPNGGEQRAQQIVIVSNWFEELKRLAPTN